MGHSGFYGANYGGYYQPGLSLSISSGFGYAGLGYGGLGYYSSGYGTGYGGLGYNTYGYSWGYPYSSSYGSYGPSYSNVYSYPQPYYQPYINPSGVTSGYQAGYGTFTQPPTVGNNAGGQPLPSTSDLRPGMVLPDGATVISVGPIGGGISL